MPGGRIFVTHATSDKPLAEALVTHLLRTTGLEQSQVFCSSVPGMGIPTGDQLIQHLEKVLGDTVLVIQLITPAYLHSDYCMWELGATWIQDSIKKFPMHVPKVEPGDIREGPLAHRRLSKFDSSGLIELHEVICQIFGLSAKKPTKRTSDGFVAKVPALYEKCEAQYHDLTWFKTDRSARYATAMPLVHEAFHHLRDAGYLLATAGADETTDPHDSTDFRENVRASLDSMTNAFSEISGTKCRMCIKKLEIQGAGGTQRDSQRRFIVSNQYRSANAPQRAKTPTDDFVDSNTDFAWILNEDNDVFFSNDLIELAKAGKYINSHWNKLPPTNPAYRSTIVWPIRKKGGHPLSIPNYEPTGNELRVQYGFVCVDSKEVDTFREADDIQLGSAYADTLFTVLWSGPPLSEF
jgi:TIR domain-containing protein